MDSFIEANCWSTEAKRRSADSCAEANCWSMEAKRRSLDSCAEAKRSSMDSFIEANCWFSDSLADAKRWSVDSFIEANCWFSDSLADAKRWSVDSFIAANCWSMDSFRPSIRSFTLAIRSSICVRSHRPSASPPAPTIATVANVSIQIPISMVLSLSGGPLPPKGNGLGSHAPPAVRIAVAVAGRGAPFRASLPEGDTMHPEIGRFHVWIGPTCRTPCAVYLPAARICRFFSASSTSSSSNSSS